MDAIVDAVGAFVEGATKASAFIFAAVGIFLLMAVLGLASAFVARDYWNWFVSPLGLPRIGVLHAYGLIIFVSLLRGVASNEHQDGTDGVVWTVAKPAIGLALTWALGWLIVTFGGPF